jgi:hypothetical protein
MFKDDAIEAAAISAPVYQTMLAQTPSRGRSGSDLRTAINDFRVNAQALFMADAAGEPQTEIFTLAVAAGITLPGMEVVRQQAMAQTPKLVGGLIEKDCLLRWALAAQGQIIANMTFTSRDDVDALKGGVNDRFADSEEAAADDMDSATYRKLVALHAAISFHLIETARPLPNMATFWFATPGPTLYFANRLYADASRADELRDENKVIHPAFMVRTGRALSS